MMRSRENDTQLTERSPCLLCCRLAPGKAVRERAEISSLEKTCSSATGVQSELRETCKVHRVDG